ncbi:MAG: hypothetical protein J6J57_04645 [Alistipes sp.]|nr:hypothetical protein [Alistipes sp.]
MKNLFLKVFILLAVVMLGGGITVSCTGFDGDLNFPQTNLPGDDKDDKEDEKDEGKEDEEGDDKESEKGPFLEIADPVIYSAIKVDIPITTRGLAAVGYKVVEKGVGKAPASALVLFRSGKTIDGNSEVINLTGNDGLDRGKTFVVYIAATVSSTEFYNDGEIFSVEFTTPNAYADSDVVVLRTNAEGADIYVQVPEHVKQEDRRLKWGVTNIAMLEYNGNPSIPEMLHTCDWVYPAYVIKNDTTLNINHYNVYRRNAAGEIGYYVISNSQCIEVPATDPRVETGEAAPISYYYHFQPGEPLLVLMSEVYHTDCDEYFKVEYPQDHLDTGCDKKHPTIDYGWGPGWYWYPFDMNAYKKAVGGGRDEGELPDMGVGGGGGSNIDSNKFWHEGAWYKRVDVRLPGPTQFDGTVKVEVSDLKTDGGTITFTPDNKTFAYFVGLFEETNEYNQGYRDLVRDYLKGDESLMQWFTTSEMAGYFGIFPYYASEGIIQLKLEEYFMWLTPGLTYHLVVNAVNGRMEDGEMWPDVSAQNYQHITFTLPTFTKPAPELIVTPYDAYDPYKVKFNIKNANPSIPVKKVVYAANYTRDFASYMGALGYSYSDIIKANDGYANLTEAEIAKINSSAGYDIDFDVRENSNFTLAVMGWNDENRPNDPDGENPQAVAEAISLKASPATPLNMTKLNALKGDWTATATIRTIDYSTEPYTYTQSTASWKVSIGDLKTDNVFTAADYLVFENEGVDKEAADAYLAEFNQQSVDYNAAVLGQNRVLCQGWAIDNDRTLSTVTPWDLFVMPDYKSSKVDYLFFDFGPKWFLQTDADGNIFIPVHYDRVQPLTCWYSGMMHYLCGGNFESGYANFYNPNDPESVQSVGIHVEIAEDGNTITLKSYQTEVKDAETGETSMVTLYPNVIYENNNMLNFYNPYVVSDVVLTKGWSATAPTPSRKSYVRHNGKRVANDAGYQTPVKPHNHTVLVPGVKKSDIKVVTNKFPTPEQTREGMKKLSKKIAPARK